MNDNVVAYWVPSRAPSPGERVEYRWRVLWEREAEDAAAARLGEADAAGQGLLALAR